MNRRVLRRTEFTIKDNFQNIYQELLQEHRTERTNRPLPALVILAGTSGVGKTETALQLYKELFERNITDPNVNDDYIEGRFNCDSPKSLIGDLHTFEKTRELQLQSLANQRQVDENIDLGNVIDELYRVLNERFPQQIKCLTFDDAEQITNIIRHINDYICKPLAKDNTGIHKKWKIIVTTQHDDPGQWLDGCDFVYERNFHAIKHFTLEETRQYFSVVKNLKEEARDRIHAVIGGLPLALKVAREYLMENRLRPPAKLIDEFVSDILRIDPESSDPVGASLFLSLERLVDSVPYPDLARTLVQMISLLNDKNITDDILTSMAEVVIVDANGSVRPRTSAATLSRKLVKGLQDRSLCEIPDSGHFFSLHKLVKKSALLFCERGVFDGEELPPPADKVKVVRLCLIALTRVLPKDGRGHQSHTIYAYLCRHGTSLAEHIREMMKIEESSISIKLLFCNLLSSMAYCYLAQRNPIDEAIPLLDEALDTFSLMLKKRKYTDLLDNAAEAGMSLDEQKAILLVNLCDDRESSPFLENEEYAGIVKYLSRYMRLTRKDLKNIIEFEKMKDTSIYLEEGHLNERYYGVLESKRMIAPRPTQERVYMIEVLIEIYYVWIRIPSFCQDQDRLTEILERACTNARAALYLCKYIRNKYELPLMTEVIVERELLAIETKLRNRDVGEILNSYSELKAIGDGQDRRYGWEYGIRRTDFSKDSFHKLVCREEEALCKGIQYQEAAEQDREQIYTEGEELWRGLLDDSERSGNLQTLSKTYKKCAQFRKKCGKLEDAMRDILEAMFFLNLFLKNDPNAADLSPFPEQTDCGKFTAIYKILKDYYEAWKGNQARTPRRLTFLERDGRDENRIIYLVDFISHFQRHHPEANADGESKYQVMEDLRPIEEATDLKLLSLNTVCISKLECSYLSMGTVKKDQINLMMEASVFHMVLRKEEQADISHIFPVDGPTSQSAL